VAKSASETTPSMWRGALAFVRHADGGNVPRILYLRAGTSAPRMLGGSSVQTCADVCGFSRRHDSVEQLDLGRSRVAYVWRMTAARCTAPASPTSCTRPRLRAGLRRC
jgi:hypothetical protein